MACKYDAGISRLYAWGANSHGQLGLGFQSEECTCPCEVDLSSTRLNPKMIKKIVGGGGHSLIMDDQGRVYSCGWNDRGQVGLGRDADEMVLNFQQIKHLDGAKDIACGWNSSMAITKEGHVYVWGSNAYGQLGNDNVLHDCKVPEKIIGLDEKIVRGSMGLRHSALVTETGKLLVAGSGKKGQLGIVDNENQAIKVANTFQYVSTLKEVVRVACGQYHTAVLTRSGKIYTWGDNHHGQLGMNVEKVKRVNLPMELKFEKYERFKNLMTGWTHTSVLDGDGKIYSWGRSTYGQLGCPHIDKKIIWMPEMIDHKLQFRELSVGSEHNIAIDANRRVVSWGWNEHGNCGNGDTKNVLEPSLVDYLINIKANIVGSGAGHSFVVSSDDS